MAKPLTMVLSDLHLRALQALSVLALISAGLVFANCVVRGRYSEPDIEQILSSPSVIERFRRAGGRSEESTRKALAPLIKQAQAFALYLNPPPAAKRNATVSVPKKQSIVKAMPDVRPATSSPKFELHGISYYRSRPAESMALVWEPGGGHRWVKQGAQLGHFVVEQINSVSILYGDGKGTHEMVLAPGQVPVRLARKRDDKPGPKQSSEPDQIVPKPAPVRGIHRMPPERIAAKRIPDLRELNIERQ